jgi:hypothetical protein
MGNSGKGMQLIFQGTIFVVHQQNTEESRCKLPVLMEAALASNPATLTEYSTKR